MKAFLACITLIHFSLPSYPQISSIEDSVHKIFKFCTNVGPVELSIKGDSVTGWYILTVLPQSKKGTIKGILDKGLLHATWTDPDGAGDIIFGFDPGITQFIAIYNRGDDHSHWYNEWKGISKKRFDALAEGEKKNYYCQWPAGE
jgi:hypothetical protein